MRIEPQALLAIIGMALVTYATRASGFWLIGRFQISRRVETWLRYIPGSILISIIAPAIVQSGLAGVGATVITIAVAARTKSLPLAMVAGVVGLLALRWF